MWYSLFDAASLILPVLGLALLLVGVRGRLMSPQPHCRRCRFELSGLAAGAPCPECGADLSGRRARTNGLRRRRPWFIALGMVMLLVPVGVRVAVLATGLNNPANNGVKPNWLLAIEAERSDARLAAAAITELIGRVGTAKLPDETAKKLVARALEIQADPGARWLTEWGDFVSACYQRGVCDLPTYERFVRQGFTFEWETRPIVRLGRPIPERMVITGTRLGSRSLPIEIAYGDPQNYGASRYDQSHSSTGYIRNGRVDWSEGGLHGVNRLGEVNIERDFHFGVAGRAQNIIVGGWTQTYSRRITIVEATNKSVSTDDSVPPEHIYALLAVDMSLGGGGGRDTFVSLTLKSEKGLPVHLAGQVFVQWVLPIGNEQAFKVGEFAMQSGSDSGDVFAPRVELPDGVVPTQIRVIIRPDPAPAELTVPITTIWTGPELVLEVRRFRDDREQP